MKNLVLSAVLLFSFQGEAQLETVVDGLNSPIGISFNNDLLYIAEFKANHISAVRYNSELPQTRIILKGLNAPVDVIIRDDILFLSEFGSKKVSMLSINEAGPESFPQDIALNLEAPTGIALHGRYLYIAEFDGNKISRTDITLDKPNNEDFITNLDGPTALLEYDGYLYFTERKSGTISRVDISSTGFGDVEVLITGLDRPVGLEVRKSTLYFTEMGNNYISKVDFESHFSKPTVLTEVIDKGARIKILGDDLYISQRYSGDILRFSLLQLGLGERSGISEMAVYPNPTKQYISLNDVFTYADIQVLSAKGEVLLVKELKPGEKIDLGNLKEGIYFLRINDIETVRIQKVD